MAFCMVASKSFDAALKSDFAKAATRAFAFAASFGRRIDLLLGDGRRRHPNIVNRAGRMNRDMVRSSHETFGSKWQVSSRFSGPGQVQRQG